jgi:DNA-binding beta-propeller fold protein YncE
MGLVPLSVITILMLSCISSVTAQQFLTQWGSEGSGPGQFNGQNDVDPFKNHVYVADYDNNRIQVFDGNGTHITNWGTEGEGDGQFLHPHVAAADSEGNV